MVNQETTTSDWTTYPVNRYDDLELELKGIRLILIAMLLDTGNHSFIIDQEKLDAAHNYRVDTRELSDGGDEIFLVAR